MKTFLKWLLIVFIVALIAGGVIGIYLLLDRELMPEAYIVIGVILGAWLAFVVIRKLIIRYRAKRQVERVIQQEQALDIGHEKRRTPQQLLRDLRKRWRQTVGVLRRSQLKFRGDPLYVLPWYMVIGRPMSGKSTALKNARLLLPEIELPRQGEGSTVNMDWWLYEQAIVIDTAGRYAVPEEVRRDRREWGALLEMLARHKQKEPINGLVVVITADRLLEASEDELAEEGRQVRASMNELMERLEVHAPVYLLVTKCDQVAGFTEWAQYLPDEARQQSMGYLQTEQTLDVDAVLDRGLDAVLDRIKEIRLLILERSQEPGDSVLELPSEMEKLRNGLHMFARTALKENPYQDTPRFRGLFFCSSQQAQSEPGAAPGRLRDRGLFLHEFFTRVLPADRGLLDSLPSAARIRRAARTWALGVGGGATAAALIVLSGLYNLDRAGLDELLNEADQNNLARTLEAAGEINLAAQDFTRLGQGVAGEDLRDRLTDKIDALGIERAVILALEETESGWLMPWTGRFGESRQAERLKQGYTLAVKTHVLEPLDRADKKRLQAVTGPAVGNLARGLIRRIGVVCRELASRGVKGCDWAEAGEDTQAELFVERAYLVDAGFRGESADQFTDLYTAYVGWQGQQRLAAERNALLETLRQLMVRNNDYAWLIEWANEEVVTGVALTDFWSGTGRLESEGLAAAAAALAGTAGETDDTAAAGAAVLPVIEPAYTLAGKAFLDAFLADLIDAGLGAEAEAAAPGGGEFDEVAAQFEAFYARRYVKAWSDFAGAFDLGWRRLANRREWLSAMERFVDGDSAYFDFFRRAAVELAPFAEEHNYFDEMDFYNQMLSFVPGEEGGAGGGGKAAKLGLKLLGKAGKAGKLVAKVGKKGLKTAKKLKGKKSAEDLADLVEPAAASLDKYTGAMAELVLKLGSTDQSVATVSALYTTPEDPAAGGGDAADAWNAITELQKLMGRPVAANRPFWDLYTGPLRMAHAFMERETECALQNAWTREVVAELKKLKQVGAADIGNRLIGEGGLVWAYFDKHAAPFLDPAQGYEPRQVPARAIRWQPAFPDYLERARSGRELVGRTFNVQIDALPTGVNLDADISPYATYLNLHCDEQPVSLANYNYPIGKTFAWSLDKCQDVTLNIEVGHLTLSKEYEGPFGFPNFLREFRDGHHVFQIGPASRTGAEAAFAGQASELEKLGVKAIDVNYKINGLEPVTRMLDLVSLDPPERVTACWR